MYCARSRHQTLGVVKASPAALSGARPDLASSRAEPAHRARGQAVAEFAIVALPLLLLLCGIAQFALIYNAQVGLTNAIRDAARYGSTLTVTDNSTATSVATATYTKLTTSLGSYVSPYSSANLGPGTQACVSQHADGAGGSPAWITVTVAYKHPLIVPLIGAIIDAIDGTSDNAYRLTASTELRIDNPTQASVSVSGTVCSP